MTIEEMTMTMQDDDAFMDEAVDHVAARYRGRVVTLCRDLADDAVVLPEDTAVTHRECRAWEKDA